LGSEFWAAVRVEGGGGRGPPRRRWWETWATAPPRSPLRPCVCRGRATGAVCESRTHGAAR